MAPLRAMTKEIMKKERATMPRDSRQVRPMAMMEEANCQVAALVDVQRHLHRACEADTLT